MKYKVTITFPMDFDDTEEPKDIERFKEDFNEMIGYFEDGEISINEIERK